MAARAPGPSRPCRNHRECHRTAPRPRHGPCRRPAGQDLAARWGQGQCPVGAGARPRTRVITVRDREGDIWQLLPITPPSMGGGEADPGAADRACATTVLPGSARCWRQVATIPHARKPGPRIEDRHFDPADDLRTCFAFDVITALHDDLGGLGSLASRPRAASSAGTRSRCCGC